MTASGNPGLEALQARLLAATLSHVPFDGWSDRALHAGAADLEVSPGEALNAFPGGAVDLVEAFHGWADAAMLRGLEALDLEAMKVRDRIATAVRLRLEALEPHQEAERRALAFLALPGRTPLGLRLLARTVDAIWVAAGDRSTDYNYYSKRMLLAGVYSSTLLCWLNDGSEGHEETWAFLDRRISEVLKVGGRIGKTMKSLLDLPDRLAQRRPGSGFWRARGFGSRMRPAP